MISRIAHPNSNGLHEPGLADHLVHGPDVEKAAGHVRGLLDALGLDVEDEHLAGTPLRVARLYADMLTGGNPFTLTSFDAGEHNESTGPIIVRDIPLVSFCSHHLLPFTGVVHVGYVPDKRIVGLSKLARVVNQFAYRPQVQERLTEQIATELQSRLNAKGSAVLISARHACMELRGVRAVGAITLTSTFRGVMAEDSWRQSFLSSVNATERIR